VRLISSASDVGEDWAREHHRRRRSPVLLDEVGAGDVQASVRRELNAVELQVDDLGQRRDEQRLGQAGHADNQAVAADKTSEHG
jgi:hypothetical protein